MKKYIWLFIVIALAIVLVPVLIAQINPPESRSYEGVSQDALKYREISFRNESQDLDLGGMLFAPDGEGPFPAVVVIHGSGTSRRDNIWYLTLTSHLQENGIAVLLPDKRGSEKSEGDWRTASFEDLATDTLAAIEFLKDQDVVQISAIGIVGMSQGGWIAPIAADESAEVDFVISVVGSSVTTYDQVAYEEVHNLRQMGFLPGVANVISYPALFVLREITQKDFWDVVGNFDPLPYWRQVEIPVLVLYGSEDTNVPTEASKARFESLDKDNIEVKIYEGSGHALQDPPGAGNSIFREEALADIRGFIFAAIPPSPAGPVTFSTPQFIFRGDDPSVPILTHEPTPAIQNQYINPGSVIFHEGQFHMFFNSFTAWPGTVLVGYAVSDDGLNWQTVQDEPVFSSEQVPFGDGRADVSSVLVMDDGTWVMYFHTVSNGVPPMQIGRATAAWPLGPWSVDADPVLRPGPEGSWDEQSLFWPSVVRDGDGFRMYYGARDKRADFAIGMAMSEDGITWTKYNDLGTSEALYAQSDPVLLPSAEWESNKVDRPRVQFTTDGWVMIYQGGVAVENRGLAMSNDGVEWVKYPGNPLFTSETFPIPFAKTWDTSLLYHEGVYYYFMELGSLGGTDLYLAAQTGALRE